MPGRSKGYRKGGPVNVTVKGDVLGKPLEQTIAMELPEVDEQNPQIERMWAWHRAERLQDDLRSGSPRRDEIVEEIVRLCEGYSIAGEYASFIVLENDAEYQRWKIERRNATRIERDRGARLALRQELDGLRQRTARRLPGASDSAGAEVLASGSGIPEAEPTTRANAPTAGRQPSAAGAPSNPQREQPARGWDFGGGGGGALDPFSAMLALGLGVLGIAAARRRRQE